MKLELSAFHLDVLELDARDLKALRAGQELQDGGLLIRYVPTKRVRRKTGKALRKPRKAIKSGKRRR